MNGNGIMRCHNLAEWALLRRTAKIYMRAWGLEVLNSKVSFKFENFVTDKT